MISIDSLNSTKRSASLKNYGAQAEIPTWQGADVAEATQLDKPRPRGSDKPIRVHFASIQPVSQSSRVGLSGVKVVGQGSIVSFTGCVTSIDDDTATLAIDNNGHYYPIDVEISQLRDINADFVGARIRIVTTIKSGSSSTTYRLVSETPTWLEPDEELTSLIRKVKAISKRK